MVEVIGDWLNRLDAQPRSETVKAFELVMDRPGHPGWWRDGVHALSSALIQRRHFNALGTVTPRLVSAGSAGVAPCGGVQPMPLDVPSKGPGNKDLASLYKLEFLGASVLPEPAQALTAGKGAAPVTPPTSQP